MSGWFLQRFVSPAKNKLEFAADAENHLLEATPGTLEQAVFEAFREPVIQPAVDRCCKALTQSTKALLGRIHDSQAATTP